MIVPSNHQQQESYNQQQSKKLHTISLSNCFINDVDYRMHSAFRVNLKPRQPSYNTKLLEQRPNSKYTSACSGRIRPTTRNTISTNKNTGYNNNNNNNDLQSDDEYERIGTPSTLSNDHISYYQEYTLTRDAFRPSTIRKFNNSKNNPDESNNNTNNKTYITSKFGYNIEELKMRRNIKTGTAAKSSNEKINKQQSFTNLENNSESRINSPKKKLKSILKTDENSHTNNNNNKPETTSGTSVRIELDEDDLIDSSLLSPDLNNNNINNKVAYTRTTSDIFNEIYSEINNTNSNNNNNNKNNKMQSKSASIVKSATFSNDNFINNSGNLSNRSKYLQVMRAKSISEIEMMKKLDDELNGSQSASSLYLNKMREEEFLQFLKEYRITKSLQPTNAALKEYDTAVNNNNNKSANRALKKPIKSELLSIRTQFLNLYVDKDFMSKNALTQLDLPNQLINNKQQHQQQQQQQQQQPNYFHNYLKTKILLKQSKNSNPNISTPKKEDSSFINKVNSFYYEKSSINNILNTTTTKINLNKSKEKELKNQLNILNFPSIENC